MITIVDYGMGNLASIANMLKRVGCPSRITSDAGGIASAPKLILPGVGAFDMGMRNLAERGLVDVLHRRVRHDGIPVLGICLGMQLFARGSEEGVLPGLGLLEATAVRFLPPGSGERLKVPHVGWNHVEARKPSRLLDGLACPTRFYFVHSYHLRLDRPTDLLAETVHGHPFPSAVETGNLLGVQFHPEKSHSFGMRLLKNFAERY
jgi:glutamine amidotransferase